MNQIDKAIARFEKFSRLIDPHRLTKERSHVALMHQTYGEKDNHAWMRRMWSEISLYISCQACFLTKEKMHG